MHAIGNAISAANPKSHIMYVTSENFCNEMITAIRKNENEEFRAKYRNVDVLMVDDIQFISNKEGTQEEFSTPSTPSTTRRNRSSSPQISSLRRFPRWRRGSAPGLNGV